MPRTTTKQLQEELRRLKFRSEVSEHRLSAALSESYVPQNVGWGEFINPLSQFYNGKQPLFPIQPNRYGNDPIISEGQLDLIRWYSRWLYLTNQHARGILRSLQNYTIGSGYEYTICGKGSADDKSRKVKRVQEWLDEFLEVNNFFSRELDCFIRTRRDGEFFIRIYPTDGVPKLRIIEPGQVRSPDGSPETRFGVRTEPNDIEEVKGYCVSYDGSEWEYPEAAEVVHMRVNADLNFRRGISDFFATMEPLQAVQKLLNASAQSEAVRQSIAYIRQHEQASAQSVYNLQSNATDFETPVLTPGGTKYVPTTQVTPGDVQDIPKGLEFQDGPKGAGENATAILQAAYQALAVHWQMPAWMTSGDTGNVNYASSLTSEAPFTRNIQKEQKLYSRAFREIINKAIHIASLQGDLPEDILDEITVNVSCPPIAVRNLKEETDRNLILASNGIISKRTWSDKEELDRDHELEQMKLDGDQMAHQPEKISVSQSNTPGAMYQRETNGT